MLLSDREIVKRCGYTTEQATQPFMIEPMVPHQVSKVDGKPIVSYGLSSYGYDVRLSDQFKIMRLLHEQGRSLLSVPIDPLHPSDDNYVDVKPDPDGSVTIPAGGFLLGATLEHFNIPREVLVVCLGKSTYARLGLNVIVTPLEPEWSGQVVLELSNTGTRPVKVYVGQGIAQFLFHFNPLGCHVSYRDRRGKYDHQHGVVTSKV